MMSIYKSFGFCNSPYHPIHKLHMVCWSPLIHKVCPILLFPPPCTNADWFVVPILMYKFRPISCSLMYKCSSICHSLPKYKCGMVWFVHVQMWLDLSFLFNYKCGTVHSSLIYKYRMFVDPCIYKSCTNVAQFVVPLQIIIALALSSFRNRWPVPVIEN